MKIYKGFVLVAELTEKANKSAPWISTSSYAHIAHIGGIPVVLKDSLPLKYRKIADKCQDLENYYPYGNFSIEIGRTKDFMNVLEYQRKQKNKQCFDSKKISVYKLLKLSDEFIDLVNSGLQPYKVRINDDMKEYKHIITMQDMKIGFY